MEKHSRRQSNAFSRRVITMFKSETQTIQRERTAIGSSSEKERKVNALASGADEGRD